MGQKKSFMLISIVLVVLVTLTIIIAQKYTPESKAEEKNTKTIQVTYKSGIGEGEDVVVTQALCDSKTQGSNDYTDGKIVLYRNGENGINFTASQVKYEANGVMYDRILTGWKLTSVTKDGTEITEFIEPKNQNYADKTNANKDIGTVYAQEGWYIVPDGVTAITVEAVYARAIYVRSPYDTMYYDEVHCFYYGENSDGTTTLEGTAVAKSSDDNDGSTVEKAVSTLKKAYELITASSNLTVYDTAFVLCGDMYEVNRTVQGANYATGVAGSYTNYYSNSFGYNTSPNKPVTITSINLKNYTCYENVALYDFNFYSSIRQDNITILNLSDNHIKKVHSELSATIKTYGRGANYRIVDNVNMTFETTEKVKTFGRVMFYNNSKCVRINGGNFSLIENYVVSTMTMNKSAYIIVGGLAYIDKMSTSGLVNTANIEAYIENPVTLVITGGRVNNGIFGTGYIQGGSVKGDVNIFISGGNVSNVYGGGNGSVYANNAEKGNVNIIITGGIFGNIYGGGQYYTSKVNGDVNIKIKNAKINGNICGGGKGGQVLGNINLDVKETTIIGNVFGGGQGLTDTIGYYSANKSVGDSYSFETGKNIYNQLARNNKTVNWEEAPNNFPSYNQETSEVISRKYHQYTYDPGYHRFYEKGNKYFLSLATVSNDINMNIENSTIGKNVYGGGSIGLVEGNVNVTMKDTNVTGNVYGGGDGKTTPSTIALYSPIQDYKELTSVGTDSNTKIGDFSWTSDKDILTYFKGIYDGKNKVLYNSDNTTTAFSELSEEAQAVVTKYGTKQLAYSADVEKLGFVEGDITVNIDGGTYSSAIYGGGNNGQVKGNVTLELANITSNQNVYTGGNTGNVEKSTSLTINSGTYVNVFGGGYSSVVSGDSTVIINKGTCTNIFGGGDQSYVQGNTDVTIGQENSIDVVNVTGLVYGGGRGYDANNDGDASDFTTVYGNSKVLIQGVNTSVENYGSTKLGAVAGSVDVNFKNYWSGNSTAKYQTMNGIDRATTVTFENSYVLLENKDSSGNLVGIQSIENLVIPNGSGLKISANGEITGNFTGGGELYLDSLVCLTVKGNITGQTTLVLNPKLMESGNQVIRGGIRVPYLKVGGTAEDGKTALVSGESNKYKIQEASKETVKSEVGEDYIYYFIPEDVIIENDITVSTNSVSNRKYNGEITNTREADILNTGVFTTEMNLNYYLTDDVYKSKNYTDIGRKLSLVSNTNTNASVVIPIGTEICMITDEKYYYYIVDEENMSKVSLSEFVVSDKTNEKYVELKDITNSDKVTKTYNEVNGTTSYDFKENYRFILDFSNTTGINADSYYPTLEISYSGTSFENAKKDVANNIVNIQKRTYTYDAEADRTYYESNGVVSLSGELKIGSLKDNTQLNSKDLYLKLELQNSNNKKIAMPQGTEVTINDNKYQIKDDTITEKILDNLSTQSINQNLNINLDMAKVLKQDQLPSGTYKMVISYLNSKDYEKLTEQEITIVEPQVTQFGVQASINQVSGIDTDKIQLIPTDEETTRSIKIEYSNSGELQNAKIKIKAVEKTGEFEYKETNNSKKIVIEKQEIYALNQRKIEQNLNIIFSKNLQKGTYKILVEICDEYRRNKGL